MSRTCAGGCTTAQYDERVQLVRGFLDGADNGPLRALREEMVAASERLEFERAGTLRDKLQRLEGLREQFIRFRFAIETLSFVYTVPGFNGDDRVYLIRRGRVRGEYAMPRNEHDRMRLLEMVEDVFHSVERVSAQLPAHEIDQLLLLASWFRRFPAELTRSRAAAAFVAEPPALAFGTASDSVFSTPLATTAA